MKKSFYSYLIILFVSFLLVGCTSNKKAEDDSVVTKKKRIPISVDERAERDKGSIFGNLGGNNNTTYDFATSNVLWRASLEALNFLPLNTIDYSGGIIISDWYSPKISNESIKIEVRFLSNELKSSSVQVKAFKKTCSQNNCKTQNMTNSFNNKIKDNIILNARNLKIKDEKNKKK